jgi:hypothetical protein
MKIRNLFLTAFCVALISLAQGIQRGMHPRILMRDSSHCGSVLIRNEHLVAEKVCTGTRLAEVAWDGHASVITDADEKASMEWMRVHSLLPRLSVWRHDLYWDGQKVNLGKVDVYILYEAIPWEGGVMIYGRTIPRRRFWESWPFKGHFIETRDLEPFCAIYFDPKTMKGEDIWLNGMAYLGFFVFPLPD